MGFTLRGLGFGLKATQNPVVQVSRVFEVHKGRGLGFCLKATQNPVMQVSRVFEVHKGRGLGFGLKSNQKSVCSNIEDKVVLEGLLL